MPKRKRSASGLRDAESNPFLSDVEHEDRSERMELIHHLNSIDGTIGQTSSISGASSRSIDYLVDTLTSGAANERSGDTLARVSLGLLPWTIKHLLNRPLSCATVVRALEACLLFLRGKTCPILVTQTSRILTQSALLKLLPVLARASMTSVEEITAGNEKSQQSTRRRSEDDDHEQLSNADTSTRTHAASTFELLLTYYKPTLDVACKSILIPIVKAMKLNLWRNANHSATGGISVSDPCERSVLFATLQWIGNLYASGKGNPKTAFQLLSSTPVLLALIRCYLYFEDEDQKRLPFCDKTWELINNPRHALIQNLLGDGLFSPKHHLDGFRSLLMQRPGSLQARSGDHAEAAHSFRCYQEDLLIALATSLTYAPECSDEQLQDTRDLAVVVPCLFQRFMTNTDEWNERYMKGDQKLLKPEDLVSFQFQMFHRMTIPLRALVTIRVSRVRRESIASIALDSLVSCLRILLEHKGYLPTYDDAQGSQFAVLDKITHELLGCHDSDTSQDVQMLAATVTAIQTLVSLDHRLSHDRLASVYCLCVRSDDDRLQVRVTSLLETLSNVFRQLRQQSLLVRSLTHFAHDRTEKELQMLLSQLEHPSVAEQFARAIQDSPDLQIKHLFDLVYEVACGFDNSGKAIKECDMAIVRCLSLLLVTHVRIDNATAMHLSSTSMSFLNGPVSNLLLHGGRLDSGIRSSIRRTSLYLCGLFLDLHTRCSFFLGSIAICAFPDAISSFLDASMKRLDVQSGRVLNYDESGLEEFADEWVVLLCHRIHHIHAQMCRIVLVQDDTLDLEKLRAKASTFTSIVVLMAHSQRGLKMNKPSRWSVVAANAASWVPYADDSTVDMFLDRFFGLVSMNTSATDHFLRSLCRNIGDEVQGIVEEVAFAKSLLCDASFFGQRRLQSRLHLSALSCSSEWLGRALSCCTSSDPDADTQLKRAHPILSGSGGWARKGSTQLEILAYQTTPPRMNALDDLSERVAAALSNASRPLRIVNGLHDVTLDSLESAVDCIDGAFQLDHVCRSFSTVKPTIHAEVMQVAGALRKAIAKLLKPMSQHDLSSLFSSHHHQLVSQVKSTVDSAMIMSKDVGLTGEESVFSAARGLVMGSQCLLSQLLRVAMLSEEEEDKAIVLAIKSLHDKYQGPSESSRFFFIITKPIMSLFQRTSDTSRKSNLASDLRNLLWKRILPQSIRSYTSGLTPSSVNDFYSALACLIPFSISVDSHLSHPDESISAVVNSAIADAMNKEAPCGDIDSRSLSTRLLVGASSKSMPLEEGRVNDILRFASKCKYPDPLVEAFFCRAVHRLTTGSMVDWIEAALMDLEGDSANAAHNIHLLLLFLQHVPSGKHSTDLTSLAPKILRAALSHLRRPAWNEGESSSSRASVDACRVVEELIRSHHLVSFRERDLARILSHLSELLGPSFVAASQHETKWLSTELFLQCSQLFLSLFHRYTKNLYSCVPSVVSVLHSALDRVLYDANRVSDHDITLRGQAFSRMCEPLVANKDVYKKHLVGLVVEFVRALQANLSPVRKDAVMPAVFLLLDSLTTYEIKQLSTFIDAKSKPLLSTVCLLHQKHHSYKGQ